MNTETNITLSADPGILKFNSPAADAKEVSIDLVDRFPSTVKTSRELIDYLVCRHKPKKDIKLSKDSVLFRAKRPRSRYKDPDASILTPYGYIRGELVRLTFFLLSRSINGRVAIHSSELYSGKMDIGCRHILDRNLKELVAAGIITCEYDPRFRMRYIDFVGYDSVGVKGDTSGGYIEISREAIDKICRFRDEEGHHSVSLQGLRIYVLSLPVYDTKLDFLHRPDTIIERYNCSCTVSDFVSKNLPEYLCSAGRFLTFLKKKVDEDGLLRFVSPDAQTDTVIFSISADEIGRSVRHSLEYQFRDKIEEICQNAYEDRYGEATDEKMAARRFNLLARVSDMALTVLLRLGVTRKSKLRFAGLDRDELLDAITLASTSHAHSKDTLVYAHLNHALARCIA